MSSVKNMLVPGGLGFVGSVTMVRVMEETNTNVVIIDDTSNCFQDVLERIKFILEKKLKPEEI